MARANDASVDQLVQDAVTRVVARVSSAIAKHLARLVSETLERELPQRTGRRAAAGAAPRRRSRRVELTKWIADRRARRVPTFVIEMTGLDTKKKIVATYGESSAFEKGKPLPPESKREVKAKPPTIRRKNGKAAAA